MSSLTDNFSRGICPGIQRDLDDNNRSKSKTCGKIKSVTAHEISNNSILYTKNVDFHIYI